MSLKDYLYQKASAKRIPLGGTFELSPVCNFSCKMCYVRKTKEELQREGKRIRTVEEWIEMGRQCREAGTLYLLLTGGEPFLYPGFKRLYEALQDMGFVLSINTNGTMINEETLEWLLKHAPARVNITLYGSSPETYQRICGNADGYARAVNSILKLKEAGVNVVINASMIPENADDLEDIIRFGKEHDIVVNAATYMFPPVRRRPEDTDSRFTPEESGRLSVMKEYYRMSREHFICRGEQYLETCQKPTNEGADDWGSNEGEEMKCRAGRSTFWINWEGHMVACGIMDYPAVKYPFEEGFEKSWNELTDTVRSCKVMSACKNCEKKELCHPCAGIVYSETGDVNAKPEYLCKMVDASAQQWRKMLEEERSKVEK